MISASTYYVGSVDEAEEVEQGHGRNDHQIDLHSQFRFCFGVELD